MSKVFLVLAILLAAAALGILIRQEFKDQEVSQNAGSGEASSRDDTVTWNGTDYVYNEHLSNYLILGIDERASADTQVGNADAGQSDALYLISQDRVEKSVTVITIPRDTMTEIQMYTPSGADLGKSKDHISLAYAYGDGKHKSCELSEEAVSHLFYDLPIQGYCALSMDSLPVMMRSVGKVTVTVPDNSLQKADPIYEEGAQVTLNEENVEQFVRYRDTKQEGSALDRMQRQQIFLEAYGKAAGERFHAEPEKLTQLYEDLQPYMVTNMDSSHWADLMEGSEGVTQWTVPGESKQGKSYEEYHVQEESFYENIIETFYEEK